MKLSVKKLLVEIEILKYQIKNILARTTGHWNFGNNNVYVGGNVGIGTTSPTYKLDVNEGLIRAQLTGVGIQVPLLLWNTQAAAAGVGTGIAFLGESTNQAQITSAWNGAAITDAYLRFLTRKDNALAEQVRIISSGNVGIGTTAPGAKLTISQEGGTGFRLIDPRTNNSSAVAQILYGIGSDENLREAILEIGRNDVTHHKWRIRTASETGWGTTPSFSIDKLISGVWNNVVTIPTNEYVGIGTTAPKCKLDVAGGVAFNLVTKNANYTATTSDYVILCNATDGAITITLPASTGVQNMIYNIKKIDSSANTVTIDGNASETIDGQITKIISVQYDSIMIVCDGSNWYII